MSNPYPDPPYPIVEDCEGVPDCLESIEDERTNERALVRNAWQRATVALLRALGCDEKDVARCRDADDSALLELFAGIAISEDLQRFLHYLRA